MTTKVCTCWDLPQGAIGRAVVSGGFKTMTHRTLGYKRSVENGRGRQVYSREVRVEIVGARVRESARWTEIGQYIGPGHRGGHTGHFKRCPCYVPPLALVSKKRKRREARVMRIEQDVLILGRCRPHPKPGAANVPPSMPRGAVKMIRSGKAWRPELLARAWYEPPKVREPKRREKRGQGKPR